jgi:hypothetical protein
MVVEFKAAGPMAYHQLVMAWEWRVDARIFTIEQATQLTDGQAYAVRLLYLPKDTRGTVAYFHHLPVLVGKAFAKDQ